MVVDRFECLKSIVDSLQEEDIIVVLALGATKFEIWYLRPLPSTVCLGKLGGTVALGLGIALALPHRRVVVITTDGDLLMELGQLSPIVNQRPKNLKIVVLDNEYYESLETPMPSLTGEGVDLATIALANGVDYSKTVTSLEEFNSEFKNCLKHSQSTCLIVKTKLGKSNAPVRTIDAVEDKYRFVRWIEQKENKTIIGVEQQYKKLVKKRLK